MRQGIVSTFGLGSSLSAGFAKPEHSVCLRPRGCVAVELDARYVSTATVEENRHDPDTQVGSLSELNVPASRNTRIHASDIWFVSYRSLIAIRAAHMTTYYKIVSIIFVVLAGGCVGSMVFSSKPAPMKTVTMDQILNGECRDINWIEVEGVLLNKVPVYEEEKITTRRDTGLVESRRKPTCMFRWSIRSGRRKKRSA